LEGRPRGGEKASQGEEGEKGADARFEETGHTGKGGGPHNSLKNWGESHDAKRNYGKKGSHF